MNVVWWEVVGLIGVTLVISSGKIFDPLREWLKGFENELNPMKWAGNMISCSMCSGVWVGFGWGMLKGFPWWQSLVLGGVLSVFSLFTDEVMSILVLWRLSRGRSNEGAMTIPEMMELREQVKQRKNSDRVHQLQEARARRKATPKDLSEEEADAIADAGLERADSMLVERV